MNPPVRSFVGLAKLLLALGIVCLTFRLWGSNATRNAAEKTWKELLASKESFDVQPPSQDPKAPDRRYNESIFMVLNR